MVNHHLLANCGATLLPLAEVIGKYTFGNRYRQGAEIPNPLMQVLHYWSKIGTSYSTDPNLGPVTLSNQFCINPRVIHLTSRASMNPAQLKQQRYGAAEKKGAAYSRYGCTALGGRGVQSRA